MLKLLGYLFLALVVVVGVVLVIASTKPSTFSVTRTAEIAAPPEKINPFLQNLHTFREWSPWEHLDQNMAVTYSGQESGVGAKYAWKGNSKAGEGTMEIVKATPTITGVRVIFLKPFPGDNICTYTLTPTATGTHVDWTMTGPVSFPGKVMTVFTSMDKMIGGDFESGLAKLKTLAER